MNVITLYKNLSNKITIKIFAEGKTGECDAIRTAVLIWQ